MSSARSRLLASHLCTKLGSKGWEFATPLLLLRFSPDGAGSLMAPTLFGLVVFLLKFVLGPAAGMWMDRTPRLQVIKKGLALQSIGVVAALCVYGLLVATQRYDELPALPWTLIGLMIGCGVVEALGALISSVAVKKDWVPTIWSPEDSATSAELASINTWMSYIDLGAEIVGPLVAGLALLLLGDGAGFVLIGAVNVVTFGVELQLLLAVYQSNPQASEQPAYALDPQLPPLGPYPHRSLSLARPPTASLMPASCCDVRSSRRQRSCPRRKARRQAAYATCSTLGPSSSLSRPACLSSSSRMRCSTSLRSRRTESCSPPTFRRAESMRPHSPCSGRQAPHLASPVRTLAAHSNLRPRHSTGINPDQLPERGNAYQK